jgi:hypothetical protein
MLSDCPVCGALVVNASNPSQDCHICRNWFISVENPSLFNHLLKMGVIEFPQFEVIS